MKCEHAEIVQICGPMSTGGCGDFQRNMARFNAAIEVALRHGVAVFNQVLFQKEVIRICNWKVGSPYPMELLETFYGRIFLSGFLTKGLFLPDWDTSFGSRWERKLLASLGLATDDYPAAWMDEVD
jgi:hypothetical protein